MPDDDKSGSEPALEPAEDGTPRQERRRARRTPSARRTSKGPGRHKRSQAFAAIDLGTNNCRLLIARETDDGFRIIDSYSKVCPPWSGTGSFRRAGSGEHGRRCRGAENLRPKDEIQTRQTLALCGD